jgi:hypothetical protein
MEACTGGEDAAEVPVPGLYLSFNWSNERVWSLDLPTIEILMTEISWHLRAPIWSTTPGKRLFDLRPMTVIQNLHSYPWHAERIRAARVELAIDTASYDGRDVILDGVHRLARLWMDAAPRVRLRRVPQSLMNLIQSDEYPDD